MAIVTLKNFAKPLVLDLMKVVSATKNDYDLPFYFMGQVLKTNFEYNRPSTLAALGEDNGYQHLYLEGQGKPSSLSTQFDWLVQGKFYTLTTATLMTDDMVFTRLGANDPSFNLRRDAGLMLRRNDMGNTTFVSVIEPHGSYSPVSELSLNPNSNIAEVAVLIDSDAYTAVAIKDKQKQTSLLIIANQDASSSKSHKVVIGNKTVRWQGPYHLVMP